MFAWIRREEEAWAVCPLSKQEQLDEAVLAWWELWRREPLSAHQVAEALEQIGEEAPMGRQPASLTGAQLPRRWAKRRRPEPTGSRHTTGPGGRRCTGISWPNLSNGASERRRPDQLRLAHVAIIIKGGKPVRGLQAKPIRVLPLVDRAWAKIRARQIRVWLEGHTELLVGSGQEAEFQAAILAATLSLGKATGLGAGAACLDWSKAYDTIGWSKPCSRPASRQDWCDRRCRCTRPRGPSNC